MGDATPDNAREVRLAEALLLAAVLVLAGVRALPGGSPAALPGARDLVHRIDLDRSPEWELVHLPGIGPGRAAEIVRHRREHGPLGGPEGLLAVKGVGPRTVERVREYLTETGAGRWQRNSTR